MAEPIVLEWLFPQAVETQWMLPPAGPGPVAAIVGPRGVRGDPGPPGVAGDGATDPGDLTLIFNNQLI